MMGQFIFVKSEPLNYVQFCVQLEVVFGLIGRPVSVACEYSLDPH